MSKILIIFKVYFFFAIYLSAADKPSIHFAERDPFILHYAIHGCCYSDIKALLKMPKLNVNKRDMDGFTPLHLSIRLNKPHITQMLLQNDRINVNKRTKSGITPLVMP